MTENNLPSLPEDRLDVLTSENADDWRTVGDVLTTLEKDGRIASDGQQWIYKVQEKLTALGREVSVGHLHKVRRAYSFLSFGLRQVQVAGTIVTNAKISSVEIAERLYQLNPQEGLDALEACLDPRHPATAADIKRRYDAFLDKHPKKKTAMHAAWEQRKKSDGPKAARPRISKSAAPDIMSELQAYISSMQQEADERDAYIAQIEEELGETKRQLAEKEYELSIIMDDLKKNKTR